MVSRSTRRSAGIGLVRLGDGQPEVLLVHPGGPFWHNKDQHAWSIPKGELDRPDPSPENLMATARREFAEETGQPVPEGPLIALPELRIAAGKWLHAFALWGEIDAGALLSNHFELEWPPRSGRLRSFPEVDRAEWFSFEQARHKLHKGQVGLVDLLISALEFRPE
jgi:predicted NUDIX family NTP pyrophosphohydrolase